MFTVGHVQAASILPNGRLAIDGEPFFPVGLVSNGLKMYPDEWHRMIRESHANVVWDIEIAYADSAIGCEALVDSAVAAGYKLLIGSGDTWHWDWPQTPEAEVDKALYEPDEFHNLIECADHVPETIISYANRDEPVWTISQNMIGDIDSTHIMWTYDQLKVGDPDAVVAMNFAPAHESGDLDEWKSDISGFVAATDVVMFAAYPYPPGLRSNGQPTCGPKNVIGYPDCKMDRLVIGADIFRNELSRPGQPLWMIIQAFKNIPYKEMKWEAVASIVHGASGVFWAGWTWEWWDYDNNIPGSGIHNWPVTREVMSEIAGLQSILVGHDLPGAITDHPDVEARAMKGRGQQAALFAISRNGYSGTARLRVPGAPPGLVEVTVRGEQRSVSVENGWITDSFDGYEAHVYRYALRDQQPLPPDGDPTSAPDAALADGPFDLRVFPNPTRGRTLAAFHLPSSASVVFSVYDAAGRRVALAGSGRYEAGPGTIVWNGRNYYGEPVAPGVYFIRATTSRGEVATAKVLLQR